MLIFTVTKPKGKLKMLAAAGAMGLLLGVAVPLGYNALSDVGAMSMFAASDSVAGDEADDVADDVTEGVTGEGGLLSEIKQVVFGREHEIIRY